MKPEGPRGVGFLGEGTVSPSPSSRGSGAALYALPDGFGVKPQQPNGFPTFNVSSTQGGPSCHFSGVNHFAVAEMR